MRPLYHLVVFVLLFAGFASLASGQGLAVDRWAPQAPLPAVSLSVPDPTSPSGTATYPPVHGTLLPDGRVMLFGKTPRKEKAAWFTPTPFDQDPPGEVVLTVDAVPVDRDMQFMTDDAGLVWLVDETLFCSGHSLMADGSIFVSGGTLLLSHLDDATGARTTKIYGMPNATLYSYPARSWSRVPGNMPGADAGGSLLPLRWYGAVTRLADTRMLLTSGWDYVYTKIETPGQPTDYHGGTANRSVETWTPSAGFTSVSTHAHTPAQVWNHDYTHVFQFPYASNAELVLMFGEASVPVYFLPDLPAASQWAPQADVKRPGTGTSAQPSHGASSVLLPLRAANGDWKYTNGSVLQAGGEVGSQPERHIDLYELSLNQWVPILDMGGPRRYAANVLLPDGTVLVVSGYDSQGSAVPVVQHAQYLGLRPPGSFATGASVMGEVRGYHNVALLLPDGRVFVAGGRTAGETSEENEQASFRYLYPPYMSPRESPPPRPAITAAPALVHYGQSFPVEFSGGPISEAVLMGLGSMTHSFDTNQRYVQLAMAGSGPASAQLTAPANPQTAPAGWYMLFVLDANHVPSVARMVQVAP
jgi:galactose oxidase